MRYYLNIFIRISLYFLFWIMLNERLTIEVILLGVFISIAINSINKEEKYNLFNYKKIAIYIQFLLLLIKEIIVSNISVAIILLKPKMDVQPVIVKYKVRLRQKLNRTILANSITLTPGTVSVELKNDEISVHCLDEKYIRGLVNSRLERLLLELED